MSGSGLNMQRPLTPAESQAKEDAWTAQVRASPEYIMQEEQKRIALEGVRKEEAMQLSTALAQQAQRRSEQKNKRRGSILTGFQDQQNQGLGSAPGQKSILGL